jgi:hypothetical protein
MGRHKGNPHIDSSQGRVAREPGLVCLSVCICVYMCVQICIYAVPLSVLCLRFCFEEEAAGWLCALLCSGPIQGQGPRPPEGILAPLLL